MVKQRSQFGAAPVTNFDFNYIASPTGSEFHNSKARIRGILGPLGSGKSVACVAEAFTRCLRQKADKDGVRRSRWGFVRNTYPELISTTMNTWKDWVPESICPISLASPVTGLLELNLPDGTRVEAEICFLAMDSEDDVKKLKSFEFTGIWLNEASELQHKAVLDMAVGRINRYPSTKGGNPGPTWTGVIMDTNAPDDSHWWYLLAEKMKPDGYDFFRQPPAVFKRENPDKDAPPEYVVNVGQFEEKLGIPCAENLRAYIRPDPNSETYDPDGVNYYKDQLAGKDEEWIKIFLMAEYGSIFDGKPVYPEFLDKIHVAPERLEPYRGIPLLLGWDFGLTPACVICQQSPRGQLRVLAELYEEDMGIERFCRDVVRPYLEEHYHGMQIYSVGDPAGSQRSQTDEITVFQSMRMAGFQVERAPTNKFNLRREGVAWYLTKLTDGQPGFLLSPECEILRKGFRGGYKFRKIQIKNSNRYAELPEKDKFSHAHDALQYAALYLRSASVQNRMDEQFAGRGYRRNIKQKDMTAWS